MTNTTSILAVSAAALVAFVQGGLWYSPVLFGNPYSALLAETGRQGTAIQMPLMMAAEIARCLVLATCVALLMAWLRISSLTSALQLLLLLWIGFQAVTISGSVIHEGYDWRLFAIHAGDAFVKTCVVICVFYFWPWQKAVA